MGLAVIISALFIFCLIIWSLTTTCPAVNVENWVNYTNIPYGNIENGISTSFYNYSVYRRPHNYPVCHLVEYPVPHCRT